MSISLEPTYPHVSHRKKKGAEFVRSTLEWCARCCERLLRLNPGLHSDSAFNLAQDMAMNADLRARSPELVAEYLVSVVELPIESGGMKAGVLMTRPSHTHDARNELESASEKGTDKGSA